MAAAYAKKKGVPTKEDIENALGYTPAKNVHLWSDGNAVFYFDDRDTQETPLTYLQVKEIVENDENSVYLSNGYYSFYSKYLYTPGIAGENAIGFVGETQLDREDGKRVYSFIVAIHDDDTVTVSEVRLATNDRAVDKYQGTENAGKVLGIGADGNVVPVSGSSVNLTVTCTTDTGEPVMGVTVTVLKSATGSVVEEKVYNNSPIVFRILPDVTYTVTFTEMAGFALPTDKTVVADTDTTIDVVYNSNRVYGVSWDKTATTILSRTDDAALFADPVPYMEGVDNYGSPFDELYPWSGMQIVEDDVCGVLVSIPKFWYKIENTAGALTFKIADTPRDGFSVSPAHMDRGDGKGERDVVYIGRYHCADGSYKSISGIAPQVSITRATARNAIKALGEGVYQNDFAMFWTLRLLYLVEFANWNSRKTIGWGRGNGSAVAAMGYTDSMPYHTGTIFAKREQYGVSTQYRYIEGIWDNCLDWCDGITFSGANVYAQINPDEYSDNVADGTLISTRPTSGGYITGYAVPAAEGFEWALYPSAVGGSDSTYMADYCNYGAGGVVLYVGGSYSQSQYCGFFYVNGYNGVSSAYGYVGSRLQKIP